MTADQPTPESIARNLLGIWRRRQFVDEKSTEMDIAAALRSYGEAQRRAGLLAAAKVAEADDPRTEDDGHAIARAIRALAAKETPHG